MFKNETRQIILGIEQSKSLKDDNNIMKLIQRYKERLS